MPKALLTLSCSWSRVPTDAALSLTASSLVCRYPCRQSDWAIALCADASRVVPVMKFGCSCGRRTNTDAGIPKLVEWMRQHRDMCSFMHIYPGASGLCR